MAAISAEPAPGSPPSGRASIGTLPNLKLILGALVVALITIGVVSLALSLRPMGEVTAEDIRTEG